MAVTVSVAGILSSCYTYVTDEVFTAVNVSIAAYELATGERVALDAEPVAIPLPAGVAVRFGRVSSYPSGNGILVGLGFHGMRPTEVYHADVPLWEIEEYPAYAIGMPIPSAGSAPAVFSRDMTVLFWYADVRGTFTAFLERASREGPYESAWLLGTEGWRRVLLDPPLDAWSPSTWTSADGFSVIAKIPDGSAIIRRYGMDGTAIGDIELLPPGETHATVGALESSERFYIRAYSGGQYLYRFYGDTGGSIRELGSFLTSDTSKVVAPLEYRDDGSVLDGWSRSLHRFAADGTIMATSSTFWQAQSVSIASLPDGGWLVVEPGYEWLGFEMTYLNEYESPRILVFDADLALVRDIAHSDGHLLGAIVSDGIVYALSFDGPTTPVTRRLRTLFWYY